MYIPYTMPEGDQQVANWGYAAAEKNGIPYLNFVYEDLVINYATDCADEAHHLNASGAKKVTAYLGDYITAHYEVEDHRAQSAYAFWHEDYEEYRRMKKEWLDGQQNAWSYLMLLNDRDYQTKLYAAETSYIYQDPQMKELIGNIDVYGKVERLLPSDDRAGEIADDNTVRIEVYDATDHTLVSTRLLVRSEEDLYEMR